MPLVVDPGGRHEFVALRFLFVAAVALAGFLVARRDRRLSVVAAPATWWAAVIGTTGLAALVSPDPLLGLLGDTSRLMGVTAVVVIAASFVLGSSSGDDGARVVTFGLLAGSAAVVGGGLAQMVGVLEHTGRVTSTMGNAEFLGSYLCLVVPLALAVVMGLPSTRRWSVPLVAASTVVLAGTQTRGAWLGTVAGATVVVVVFAPRARVGAVAGAIALLVVVLTAVAREHGDPGSPGTAQGRIDTWRITARVIAGRPVLGWGPEGFRDGFAREMDSKWVRDYGLRQLPDRAHNRFLDVAAATGIGGLACDVGLLVAAAAALRRACRDESRRVFGIGAGGALVGWLAQGQFFFDNFDTSIVLWVLLGAVLAGEARLLRRPQLASVAIPILGAVLLVAGFGVVADRKLQHSSGREPHDAAKELDEVINLRPRSLDAYLLLGAVARVSGDPDLMRAAHRRLADWRDDEVRLAGARLLVALGDNAAAEAELRSILRRRPHDSRVRAVLAILTR